MQRGTMKGRSKGAREVSFGEYGLQVVEPAWVTAQQIEAARIAISRNTKKDGKMFIRIFPDKPITKKPAETRMGKGKGDPALWAAVVKRERIVFEISGLEEAEAKRVLKLAAYRLPMKTRFVKREQA